MDRRFVMRRSGSPEPGQGGHPIGDIPSAEPGITPILHIYAVNPLHFAANSVDCLLVRTEPTFLLTLASSFSRGAGESGKDAGQTSFACATWVAWPSPRNAGAAMSADREAHDTISENVQATDSQVMSRVMRLTAAVPSCASVAIVGRAASDRVKCLGGRSTPVERETHL